MPNYKNHSPEQILVTRPESVSEPMSHLAANRFPPPLHCRNLLFGNTHLVSKLLLRVPEGRAKQLQALRRRGFSLDLLCKVSLPPLNILFVSIHDIFHIRECRPDIKQKVFRNVRSLKCKHSSTNILTSKAHFHGFQHK